MGLLLPQTITMKYAGGNKKYADLAGITNLCWLEEFELNVEFLTPCSNKKVWYLCDLCGAKIEIYYGDIAKARNSKGGMIYCSSCHHVSFNKKVAVTLDQWCEANSKTELLERWDYTKNKDCPCEIGYASNRRFYLKCPRGLHESESYKLSALTTTGTRKANSAGCRKCASFAQWGIDNICSDFLERYWDYDKNTLNPWDIGSSSSLSVWLRCQNKNYHNSYQIVVYNFKHGGRCPYCTNDKIHPLDSFAQYLIDTYGYTEFERMWDWDKNIISPYEVPPSGTTKVYLRCAKCGESIGSRTTNSFKMKGITCRHCYGSSMELKISRYLKSSGYVFEHEYIFSDLVDKFALRFDFAVFINGRTILIEYQGEQHYKPVQFSGMPIEHANDAFSKTRKHDKMKQEYCEKHSLEFICISYKDKNDYITIIDSVLRKYAA